MPFPGCAPSSLSDHLEECTSFAPKEFNLFPPRQFAPPHNPPLSFSKRRPDGLPSSFSFSLFNKSVSCGLCGLYGLYQRKGEDITQFNRRPLASSSISTERVGRKSSLSEGFTPLGRLSACLARLQLGKSGRQKDGMGQK